MPELNAVLNSEEMDSKNWDRRPFKDPFVLESVVCGEGTMYEETCKFKDCKYSPYNSTAPHGCTGCQSKAEESDIGI